LPISTIRFVPPSEILIHDLATGAPVRLVDPSSVTVSSLASGAPSGRLFADADLTEDLRLADLAAAVPLSPYHFSRLFKATTGLTPHRYVMRCRAEAARAMLARGHLGLDEIARRTGFADRAHLTRQFRRHFGTTPGAFRAAGV
jgi:AraC-like DNA-binding protein